MKFSTEKRFIAGVICPKCSALDKLVAYAQDDTNYRECLRCGFKKQKPKTQKKKKHKKKKKK